MASGKHARKRSESKTEIAISTKSVKIYARIRKLFPWESAKISIKQLDDNTIQNKKDASVHSFKFDNVFGMQDDADAIFDTMCKPLILRCLEGYNSVLIGYGQTGSGKTYTLLGKPEKNVKGLLTMALEYLLNEASVSKICLSAVEAYGTHVSRINLFDLFYEKNQGNNDWGTRVGKVSLNPTKLTQIPINSIEECQTQIMNAHNASHFAPTGKNPESSRGHVAFIVKITSLADDKKSAMDSYFVVYDLAGSEGESALTADFMSKADASTVMARRLEAGVINTGLSQLQVIFSQLKKGKVSSAKGHGIRRVLRSFIDSNCMISVIFTFSPSISNVQCTASTLRFASEAGMVKVKTVKAKQNVNLKALVEELENHIAEQTKLIEELDSKIEENDSLIEKLKKQLKESRNETKIFKEKYENELKLRMKFENELNRCKLEQQQTVSSLNDNISISSINENKIDVANISPIHKDEDDKENENENENENGKSLNEMGFSVMIDEMSMEEKNNNNENNDIMNENEDSQELSQVERERKINFLTTNNGDIGNRPGLKPRVSNSVQHAEQTQQLVKNIRFLMSNIEEESDNGSSDIDNVNDGATDAGYDELSVHSSYYVTGLDEAEIDAEIAEIEANRRDQAIDLELIYQTMNYGYATGVAGGGSMIGMQTDTRFEEKSVYSDENDYNTNQNTFDNGEYATQIHGDGVIDAIHGNFNNNNNKQNSSNVYQNYSNNNNNVYSNSPPNYQYNQGDGYYEDTGNNYYYDTNGMPPSQQQQQQYGQQYNQQPNQQYNQQYNGQYNQQQYYPTQTQMQNNSYGNSNNYKNYNENNQQNYRFGNGNNNMNANAQAPRTNRAHYGRAPSTTVSHQISHQINHQRRGSGDSTHSSHSTHSSRSGRSNKSNRRVRFDQQSQHSQYSHQSGGPRQVQMPQALQQRLNSKWENRSNKHEIDSLKAQLARHQAVVTQLEANAATRKKLLIGVALVAIVLFILWVSC